MNSSVAPQTKFQLDTGQIRNGAILMAVGGALALAGIALAGTALVAALQDRVQQMEVPPSDLAKQHWSAVRQATSAGVGVWRKEQPGVPR
jgi:hypothetical protein